MSKIKVVLSKYNHHNGGLRIGLDDEFLSTLDADTLSITEEIFDHCLQECWVNHGIPTTTRSKLRIKTILECHNVEVIFK